MQNNSSFRIASRTQIDYDNTAEENIAINESKARLIYRDFIKKAPRLKDALGYFSLALTCFVAAMTGDFSGVFGLEGSGVVIHALFWIGVIFFFDLFCVEGAKCVLDRKKHDEDGFINALKKSGQK